MTTRTKKTPAKKVEKKAELTTLEVTQESHEDPMVLPSSIADRFTSVQVNFEALIPQPEVPVYIQFLETECKLGKVKGIQDDVFCTITANIQTGEKNTFVLKKVLMSILVENGYAEMKDKETVDLSGCVNRYFGIVAKEKRQSKEAGRAYTPYTVFELFDKQ